MIKINRIREPEQSERLEKEKKRLEEYIKYINNELNSNDYNNNYKSFSKFNIKDFLKIDKNWYDELQKNFNNKCAYCENDISLNYSNIDRFRPIKVIDNNVDNSLHYVWLAYEWTNLFPICKECNYHKSNLFPVNGSRIMIGENLEKESALILNPCLDFPEEHLYFHHKGIVIPKTEIGKNTIDLFKLNREILVKERENNYFQCKNLELKEILLVQHRAVARQYCVDYFSKLNILKKREIIENEENYKVLLELFNLEFKESIDESFSLLNKLMKKYVATNAYAQLSNDNDYSRDYIKKIEVNEVRGLSFEYIFPKLNKTPWLMILGENGTGKTTILQSITLSLIGTDKKLRLGDTKFTNNDRYGFTEVTFENLNEINKILFYRNIREFQVSKRDIAVAAYGSIRISSKNNNIKNYEDKFHDIKNLFPTSNHSHFLVNPCSWIDTSEKIKAVSEAIIEVLPNENDKNFALTFDNNSKKFYIKFQKEKDLELQQLSSGYQSIIILVMDIIRSICNIENNLGRYSKGIVMIDEIDAHLHPSWKIKIVESFRTVFPNIQFIVTTHDPLCLRGLEVNEIIVIKKYEDNKVEVLTELPYQGDLKIEQILTSDLFGLTSTLDPAMEGIIREKYKEGSLNEPDLTNKKVGNNDSNFKYYGYTRKEKLAFQIIDEALKNREVATLDELDQHTKNKVLSLWGLHDKN